MRTLVILHANWADEFDVHEYRLLTQTVEEVWLEIDNLIARETYFGTNEGWDAHMLRRENFSVNPIAENAADVLRQHLGTHFGVGILSELFSELFTGEE